jgi:hypothetical protein
VLRDQSIAFDNRRVKWLAALDPVNDVEEFLV